MAAGSLVWEPHPPRPRKHQLAKIEILGSRHRGGRLGGRKPAPLTLRGVTTTAVGPLVLARVCAGSQWRRLRKRQQPPTRRKTAKQTEITAESAAVRSATARHPPHPPPPSLGRPSWAVRESFGAGSRDTLNPALRWRSATVSRASSPATDAQDGRCGGCGSTLTCKTNPRQQRRCALSSNFRRSASCLPPNAESRPSHCARGSFNSPSWPVGGSCSAASASSNSSRGNSNSRQSSNSSSNSSSKRSSSSGNSSLLASFRQPGAASRSSGGRAMCNAAALRAGSAYSGTASSTSSWDGEQEQQQEQQQQQQEQQEQQQQQQEQAQPPESRGASASKSRTAPKRKPPHRRPLGLLLRDHAVCCCALTGERSLVAVGLKSGEVEIYRLLWSRNPVQRRACTRRHQQRMQEQQRLPKPAHRNVERDGFTLLPQLLHVLTAPEDVSRAAAAAAAAAHAAGNPPAPELTLPAGALYQEAHSVQSLQWTADGAALAVRWVKGGAAVYSHLGDLLFSLADPLEAAAWKGAAAAPAVADSSSSAFSFLPRFHPGEVLRAGAAPAKAAAAATGAAEGAGQLCSWVMGDLSLLHVMCLSYETSHQAHSTGTSPKGCDAALPADAAAEDDATLRSPPEQLVEVSIVRSASVAAAASAVDVSGSRCSSDLTSRVLLGGSHLLVWSFLGAGRPAASLSLIPLPPCLYTAKAFPLRQAALSPDGAQLLVAGSRGVALFALLQRRWRLLCSERQEAQLPTGLLPLGWYTNDIFFATTSASIPLGGAPPAAAAAPEPRSLLGATDASPRWLLPLHIHRGVEAAVAAAVESCPSRFADHIPFAIHEQTAWLQLQHLHLQHPQQSSLMWGAAADSRISSSRLGASFSSGTTARETRIGSGTHNMRHYAMVWLSSSERLDLRCRVAEITRLPARPQITTVLPPPQHQRLLRPTTPRGFRCCLCERNDRGSCSGSGCCCCVVCSGAAACALQCFYAGDASKPVLAVFDALRLLTAYQLQPPCHERRRHQQYDVAALWQLDLSDFCDRPPQQIRFVGCVWLLLLLLQSGDLLLLRLGAPGKAVHTQPQQRSYRIPRLAVEAATLLAQGVTGLWSGAEAQMREHYVLPSAHVRVLRSRKLQEERDTGCRRELLPACCCCTCTAPVGLSSQPPGPSEHGEQELQQPAVVTAAFGSSGEKGISVLRDNRSGLHGAGVAHIPAERASGAKNTSSRESSNPFSRSSSGGDDATEGGLANFPFRWSAPGDGLCGKRLSSAHGASNSNFFRNADSIDSTGGAAADAASSAALWCMASGGAPTIVKRQTFQGFVDFPRPAAAMPLFPTSTVHASTAERPRRGTAVSPKPCKASKKVSEELEDSAAATGHLEAYTRGACCTLPSPPADYGGGTAAVAAAPTLSSQAEPGGRTLERRTSVTEAPLFRSECHSSAGVPESSAPPFNDPMVSAQPREARTDGCDFCCCCMAGWAIWAQSTAGLMLTSVTFHYSGTSTAALANHTPEQLVEATDVRLRSALVLLVEKRPQPLHILGIIGEMGVAVACSPSRDAALGVPLQTGPVMQLRLLLQPCMHALLQRLLLAAAARIPLYSQASLGCLEDCENRTERSTRSLECSGSNSHRNTCVNRLLESISDLVDEFQSSPLAPHLLELCQVGLLMRCISTYSKAGKAHRMQLRAQETTEQQPEIHSPPASASTSSPSVLHASTLEKSTGNERVVAAAAAALMKSPEGIALLWLLRTLQQQSPQLFLATVVSCMRKTEPLVSPAVLGSLLQQQLPPADPVALFTKSLNSGLLHTASLYLLPIQATEGPLEVLLLLHGAIQLFVRCRRVLPLLRAALAVGDFHLVRKLLHFFWAFFTHRRHPEPVGTLRSIGDQHHWESSALKSASDMASQRAPKAERAISQQKAKQQRRLQERNRQREELQSLLWRPLNGGVHLSGDATFAHPAVNEGNGLFAMTLGEPCLSCVPLELAAEDRLLAARIYQEVENAVAVAAQTLFRQQQWLRLFEFATILALDLPSWLRDHRSSTLWHPTRPPHQQDTNARLVCVTAVPDTASPTRAAKEAAGVLPRDFFAAVSSFAQQFPVGEKPIFLHLHRPRRQKSSTLRVQRQAQQHPQVHVARMPTEAAPVPEMQSAVVPVSTVLQAHSFCTSGNMQYHSAAQIARYLGNVLLLAGHPMYALALAAAVRDMQAATHLLGWFPEMRYWVSEAATGRALDGSSEDRVMLWLSRAATSGTSPLEYRNAN
ncbi:uncharacterized protein LOC34623350 [Cyclospora cayetanensis]|uniref:Uncharacterized protein LOC34623350 n=1 Tax=Cyclospora cayetanensis TaxID=88456 RepID=A0A6P6RYT3_9EIME|nr:uncharacterized protein LOC34623350 [Cyclospora cayetanensis]